MTLNLAQTSVAKSRPSVPYWANFKLYYILLQFFHLDIVTMISQEQLNQFW